MSDQRVAEAQAFLERPLSDPYIRHLQGAGAQGDVDALMALAVRMMTGRGLPQDIAMGRALMRQAVLIGHVDGALMEAALVANGNGNVDRPDWKSARILLERAALNDPVAAEHQELLKQMALDEQGAPLNLPAAQQICDSPKLRRYAGFLTPEECAHVARVAADLLEPSTVIDPRHGKAIPHPIRTSDGGAIGPLREDLIIRSINLRIAAISNTRVEQGEPLTVLRYRVGQQYRSHVDTIAGATNQRILTVLIYLNEGFGGGQTRFPQLNVTIEPRGGDAIVFDTTLPDGAPDLRMLHSGEPVTSGSKWLATRWIRQKPVDPWTLTIP